MISIINIMQPFRDNGVSFTYSEILLESLRSGLASKREHEQSDKVGMIKSLGVSAKVYTHYEDELKGLLPLTKSKVSQLFNSKGIEYASLVALYKELLKLHAAGVISDELLKHSKECCNKALVNRQSVDELCNLIDGK